jgi:hypothetical protein
MLGENGTCLIIIKQVQYRKAKKRGWEINRIEIEKSRDTSKLSITDKASTSVHYLYQEPSSSYSYSSQPWVNIPFLYKNIYLLWVNTLVTIVYKRLTMLIV